MPLLKPLFLALFSALAALALAVPSVASAVTIEATALCAEAPNEANECEEESYGPETAVVASSAKVLFMVDNVFLGIDGELECKSEIKGEPVEDQDESPLLAGKITSLSFDECEENFEGECEVTAVNLPYEAHVVHEDVNPGDGRLFLFEEPGKDRPGAHVLCEEGPVTVNCTYEVNENTSEINGGATDLAKFKVEGGSSASIVGSSIVLEEASGVCPGSSPTMSGTYQVNEPAPMFVAKRSPTIKISPTPIEFKKAPETLPITIENDGSVPWKIKDIAFVGTYGLEDPNSCAGKELPKKGDKCTVKMTCNQENPGTFIVRWIVLNKNKSPSGGHSHPMQCEKP